ncbi:methionyl-tRNA formyltransferase [Candidatus Gracilibacteria bacterium]|nr:methionyl-tRNA formyltransferase [Candidatus Gracilibacteria bacterium]MBP7057076.1 methionyl-tRNA formyltransferase [Candidatus Gracilibacteria bacterium]
MIIRTLFFGTPTFAQIILPFLHHHPDIELVAIVCQPDKPVGRKQILTPPPTKVYAESEGIPVWQPKSLRTPEAQAQIEAYQPDLIIVAAYGKIIPEAILAIPKYQALNVHPSALPKYRGASPLQFTLWSGEKTTKTSIMVMEPTLDTGPVIAQADYVIKENEIYATFEATMALLSAELLSKTITPWCKGELKAIPQDHPHATYTKILTKEDGLIDWTQSATQIDNHIRALSTWPGTFTILDGKRIKILAARVSDPSIIGAPGTLHYQNKQLLVCCGNNTVLAINQLQLEGKNPIDSATFMRGHPQFAEHVFSSTIDQSDPHTQNSHQ